MSFLMTTLQALKSPTALSWLLFFVLSVSFGILTLALLRLYSHLQYRRLHAEYLARKHQEHQEQYPQDHPSV